MKIKLTVIILALFVLSGYNNYDKTDAVKDNYDDIQIRNEEASNGDHENQDDLRKKKGLFHISNPYGESFEVPVLPTIANTFDEFIPEGWTVIDSISLDFDEDKMIDAVGVLEILTHDDSDIELREYPRILFAIRNTGNDSYELSFQDINLIRNRSEGGIFGDPYIPLSTNGHNFETHAYGGSAWRWSERYVYEYINNKWYMVESETTYGYGAFVTHYTHDNYISGIGVRGFNSDTFEKIEEREEQWEPFDLRFEISLDAPYMLVDFSEKWFLAEYRLGEFILDNVNISNHIDMDNNQIDDIIEAAHVMDRINFIDNTYIVYTFKDSENSEEYLAIIDRQKKEVNIILKRIIMESVSYSNYDQVEVYKNKLYFTSAVVEEIKVINNEGQQRLDNEVVSVKLNTINVDGSDLSTIGEFNNEVADDGLHPYFSLNFELHNDKVILHTYGSREKLYYIMDLDGKHLRKLGKVEKN